MGLRSAVVGLVLLSATLSAYAPLNADRQGVALHGYDPVAYRRLGKALKGRPKLDAPYGGVTFLFATDSNRALFQMDPKAYLPAYGGWCAYGMASGDFVDADPESFKILSGTAHVFYKGFFGDRKKKWEKDEARLKKAADEHWKRLNEAPSK